MDYIIQPGDTLGAIAKRFGITLAQLLAANPQITNPDQIFVGQRITIPGTAPPPTGEYVVRPGDTLSGIAAAHGLTLTQLLAANPQITNPNVISVGQRIKIPSPAPPPGVATYTIQPGDTLYAIARRLGTTVDILISLNPGINPSQLMPGQIIKIPATAQPAAPGCIVYVSTRSGQPELWRSDATGAGAVQITRGSGTASQPVAHPQWSPDGKFVAYQAVGGLFVIDPCGRRPIRLAADVFSYSWSHDSTRIAYSNNQGTFVTNLQGESFKVAANFFNPDWFPGDNRLAGSAAQTDEIRFPYLVTVDLSGANYTPVTPPVPANIVRLSPDGRYAATQIFQGFAYGVFSSVFVHDFSTNNTNQMPGEEIPYSPSAVRNISFLGNWSPDGTRVVYSTITALNGQGEIRVATPQGSIQQRFSRSYYPFPLWGPANDWIMFALSQQPGTEAFAETTPRNLYVLNITTGQELKITSQGDNYSPDWQRAACPACY